MQDNHYIEYAPPLCLQPLVHCYWSYSAHSAKSLATSNPIIPDGCVDIIFDLNVPTQSKCLVVGPMTKPIQNTKSNLFGARFKPGMASLFFPSPLKEMVDQIVEINDLQGQETDTMADSLANMNCPQERLSRISSMFQQILSDQPVFEKQIQSAISIIELSSGRVSIQEITQKIGCSRQHLTRKFQRHTGLTPKFFSQVVRVNRLIEIYKTNSTSSLGDLAQICGYYDQSHMISEFKKITGITPQSFLKNA
ncbi:helix-turn-helix transcriptional regulator [Desulfogranum mediterraneum]|uniref:helix-turn-helix transcriptional regulator n=1 Tax=Desulfogranum mediterraneum TaxID=160661 RepID=UPI00048C645A|nr:helix-turn-helix transcriptional regulator [Desulfogranum mediterraneum]